MFYLIYNKIKWRPNALRKAASYWYSNARLATLQVEDVVIVVCMPLSTGTLFRETRDLFAVLLYLLVDLTKFCYVSLSISSLGFIYSDLNIV